MSLKVWWIFRVFLTSDKIYRTFLFIKLCLYVANRHAAECDCVRDRPCQTSGYGKGRLYSQPFLYRNNWRHGIFRVDLISITIRPMLFRAVF